MANQYGKILGPIQIHHASAEEWEKAKAPRVGGGGSGEDVILKFAAKSSRSAVEVRVDDDGNLYLGPAE
jgi:hypothetical protein